MKKRPSTGQIKCVPFLRNNASFGHCKGGSSNSCRSAIVKSTMCGEVCDGGGVGVGISSGVVVVLMVMVVVVVVVVVVVAKRGTTTINYNTYRVVLIAVVSVEILMVLG